MLTFGHQYKTELEKSLCHGYFINESMRSKKGHDIIRIKIVAARKMRFLKMRLCGLGINRLDVDSE